MPPADDTPRRAPKGALLRRLLSSGGPLLGLVAVFVLFALLKGDAFWTAYNLKEILQRTVIITIAGMGMTLIIMSGGIDLSVGSVVALAMVVPAAVIEYATLSARDAGLTPDLTWIGAEALAAALLAGGLCGLVNGVVTVKLRLPPFIVTLGMLEVVRGLAKWVARSEMIVPEPTWINRLMELGPDWPWWRLSLGSWIMLGLVALTALVLRFTLFGRYTVAIGSNEETARLCGLRVDRLRIVIYTLGGLAAGLAGLLYYAELQGGDPTGAVGLELQVIAAVVIGGASLSGGEGSAFGTLIGALIMAVLANGCTILGVPAYVQNLIIGAVIIAAVAVDRLKHRWSAT